jgi:hypothetical protein
MTPSLNFCCCIEEEASKQEMQTSVGWLLSFDPILIKVSL